MAINAHRYDRVEIEGYVPSPKIEWGWVEPNEYQRQAGIDSCYRVSGVYVVSDGIVTEGREVRKFPASERRVGYNAAVEIIGQVERVGRKWVAYVRGEEIGRYPARAAAARAIYAATR